MAKTHDALEKRLICIAKRRLPKDDPAHDIAHALHVLHNAKLIAKEEHVDMEVIIPAALFHDIVNYPKDSPRALRAPDESAVATRRILKGINYPRAKIKDVETAISSCSFNKGVEPTLSAAKIIQDADGLEATGAISIMRTFSTSGAMNRPFYSFEDPFCARRKPQDLRYGLDLFYTRLLVIEGRMHTKTAKRIAHRRTEFLKEFLSELKGELGGLR
jgi:uncharacterized protein